MDNAVKFNVCSYNIGSRPNDYALLCKFLNPDFKIKTQEEDDEFNKKYLQTEIKTSSLIQDQASVFCFQEVVDTKRPIIQSMSEKGFSIIYFEGNECFDSAIALDKNRFKEIFNHSINISLSSEYDTKDVAIASAIEIQSNKKFIFVSAHIPGFDFSSDNIPKEAVRGDLYCQKIMQKLTEIGKDHIQVIGADVNAFPEKWSARFEIFKNHKFKYYRTNLPTNVYPRDQTDVQREIDYIFIKSKKNSFGKTVKTFSSRPISINMISDTKIGWDAEKNCSDHIPIICQISLN